MKIAISCAENNKNASVDSRFGRAKYFAVFDADTHAFTFVENKQALDAAQGAGIQSAQHVVNAGADVLLTGHCGPKAFKVLSAANIKIYADVKGTLSEAIEAWKNNQLQPLQQADVEGHWI